jgi:hypothetical protein
LIISYVFFLISYDIIEPEDGEWGVFTNGSSWTGLIGQLQKRVCINYCFHENNMLMFRHAKRETHEKKPTEPHIEKNRQEPNYNRAGTQRHFNVETTSRHPTSFQR